MQVKVRPYIWESANRPMFVRSVWLDTEGHRHVLLDEEKRKRKENRSMRRTHTERHGSIEDLPNFGFDNFGVNGRELQTTKDTERGENKNLAKKLDRGMGKLRACRKMCEKSDISFVSLKHQLNRSAKTKKMKTIETKDEEKADEKITKSPSKEDESHKNQLTERVLNWLDKTGKFTSINPSVKREKIALPEIHVKENDAEDEWNTENFDFAKKVMSAENILRPRVKTASIPLKRSESVHTLSLTFDDDDGDLAPNPYGLSRCRSAALRFGDFFPATYKCSKKFLSLCSRKTSSASSLSANSSNNRISPPLPSSASASNLSNLNEQPETTRMTTSNGGGMTANSIVISLNNLDLNKLEEESNTNATGNRNIGQNNSAGMEIGNNNGGGTSRRRKILRRKDTLIENQYRHIIHKHILETQCNTQIVKRQLHIFIPKLPKKDKEVRSEELKPPAHDNECDSCLSTVFSEAN